MPLQDTSHILAWQEARTFHCLSWDTNEVQFT